jgi:DNA-binding transcriptional MocR family regulator
VHIEPFFVEQWMNAHETTATWNIAETCVHSLTLDELLEMSGDADGVVRRLRETWLGYGDIVGSPRLRTAIAALYGERIAPDNVLTANGAIGANFLALYALVEPGTSVVSVQPTYQQLFSVPESLGAEVREVRLREEDGYLPDPAAIRAVADETTRLIILNNPNTRPARSSTSRCCARSSRWHASSTRGCSATRCTACWSMSRAPRLPRSPTCMRRA